jgi:demethylmenaquinone methyltransferase/2-methoxy-6-polyprenyl-1,4-benzoquinol methylase
VESKFYQADEHRAEKVQQLFATIARRYDLLNDIMSAGLHRRWKRRLVELADGKCKAEGGKPKRVLDLCCGTGDIALAFARAGADVTGADFTEEMLRVAKARTEAVRWVRADALGLPFPDNSFDVVSVGYGLRNLADIERGLREILRVLKPGGKFLGRVFCGDPDTHGYILASLQDYPAQRGIQELMETCGYRECGFEEFWLGSMAINYGVKPK